jgi:hypothetical protein
MDTGGRAKGSSPTIGLPRAISSHMVSDVASFCRDQSATASTSRSTMHVDEMDTDVGLVSRLLAGQFPRWADRAIEPVPSAGTDNALYRLGDDMAVRLPRIHWAVKDVHKEHHWLPRLAPAAQLVPAGACVKRRAGLTG